MIPANQLEDLKEHESGRHHEGNEESGHDTSPRYQDPAIELASASGQHPLVIPGGLAWDSPSIHSGRGKPAASPALVGGALNIQRPRLIHDLAQGPRWAIDTTAGRSISRLS